jgi:deaminated glutathione amidase
MRDELKVACVQMMSGPNKDLNIERAALLIRRAAAEGVDIAILPEHWNLVGSGEELREAAETLEAGESIASLRRWARELGINIIGGSMAEKRSGENKVSNTCVVIGREGTLESVYRKIHLFDVCVGGMDYNESSYTDPGSEQSLVSVDSWSVGLTICYDLRFPELFRDLTLSGAELITVPANFTVHTGKDHWELLLRCRAVENQLYVAAAAQYGESRAGRPAFGRSMICNPWGTVLAQVGDGEGIAVANIDRKYLRQIRHALPSMANRVPAAYSSTRHSSDPGSELPR